MTLIIMMRKIFRSICVHHIHLRHLRSIVFDDAERLLFYIDFGDLMSASDGGFCKPIAVWINGRINLRGSGNMLKAPGKNNLSDRLAGHYRVIMVLS